MTNKDSLLVQRLMELASRPTGRNKIIAQLKSEGFSEHQIFRIKPGNLISIMDQLYKTKESLTNWYWYYTRENDLLSVPFGLWTTASVRIYGTNRRHWKEEVIETLERKGYGLDNGDTEIPIPKTYRIVQGRIVEWTEPCTPEVQGSSCEGDDEFNGEKILRDPRKLNQIRALLEVGV